MTPEARRPARAAALALLAIETLALYGLLQRESDPPVIFGFYSPQFFPIVVLFIGMWLVTLYVAWRPAAAITTWVANASRWLRKRWWLFAALAYGALEGWYALIEVARTVFFPSIARRPFMTALLLLLVWAIVVGVLAGRSRDERRQTMVNLALAAGSALITFWLLSYVLVRVLNVRGAGDVVHAWADFGRYDYRLGYRGKPNLRGYHPPLCPEGAQDATYFTDEQGFRNPPGAEEAPLVVVGDSFVFGICANYEDLWTTHLGEALDTPVANYALPGMGLWQYNAYIDVLVRQGHHAVLVYGVYANDLVGEPDYDRSLYDRLAITGILNYMSPVNAIVARYLTTSPASQIYSGLTTSEDATPEPTVTLDNGIVLRETGVLNSQFLGPDSVVGERLAQAMAYADEMDMAFVAVMIPSKRSAYQQAYVEAFPQNAILTEREDEAYDSICAWLIERGALCYNLTDDMRQAVAEGPPLYFTTDGHWNPAGMEVAADLVADYLDDNLPQATLDALHAAG